MNLCFDAICDKLIVLDGTYASEESITLIGKTLLFIPEEVREVIIKEKVVFICGDGCQASYIFHPFAKARKKACHFIILSGITSMENEKQKMYVIAHGIAQFYWIYNHRGGLGGRDIEDEAEVLCKEWFELIKAHFL